MIKEKLNKFWKVAFWLSIASVVIQGLLKLIFKVDWFDLEINQNISNFFLFKNMIAQTIIMQLLVMYNYTIFIAIANKVSIKSVITNVTVMLLLLSTYLLNLLDQQTIFYMTTVTGLIINIVYNLTNKRYRNILSSSLKFLIISLVMLLYQYITITIRLNGVPSPSNVYGFYEQIVYMFDMYILAYFYYKLKGVA